MTEQEKQAEGRIIASADSYLGEVEEYARAHYSEIDISTLMALLKTWGPLFYRAGAAHVFQTYDCYPKAGDFTTSPSPLP